MARSEPKYSVSVLTLILALATAPVALFGQSAPAPPPTPSPAPESQFRLIPLPPQQAVTPGQILLIKLETEFAQDVALHGGKAFASWFEDDAVALSNGQPAVRGRAGIAATATWDPKDYRLTWVAQGAEMGPSNDMGYTWGKYQGRSRDKSGHEIVKSGRYITVWKKQPGGKWKVALDASADSPPAAPRSLP